MNTSFHKKGWLLLLLACAVMCSLLLGCFLDDDDDTTTTVSDTTAPTVLSIDPDYLGVTDYNGYLDCSGGSGCIDMVIVFSETMDTASLVIGGELAPNVAASTWSKLTYDNDRLTLSSILWGRNLVPGVRTITIDASDKAGNPVATISRLYEVN